MGGSEGDAFFGLWIGAVVFAGIGWIVWLVALIDVIRREFDDPNMKLVWVVVVACTGCIGAVIYWFMGVDQGRLPGPKRTAPRGEEDDLWLPEWGSRRRE